MRKTIKTQPEQNTRTITNDAHDGASLRLSCATAILAIIEADAHEDNELSMASWVIAEALHGVGLLINDAKGLLSRGAA